MNKNNIETTKIKVNNGQELIQKAQEYKNSGGEWKLLESYWTTPIKGQTNQEKGWAYKNNSEGVKISNGKQEVDIYFEGLERRINFNLTDEWKEIKQIFPEISQTIFDAGNNFYQPGKTESKGKYEILTSRMLNAWSVGDIFKIITDFYKENKAEIKKSVASLGFETSLKHWIKVGNDNDGNIFIWLGKRDKEKVDMNGGGELQVSINRKDLERYSTGSYSRGRTIFWKDLDNQQLADEMLETRINPFWRLRHLINNDKKDGAISVYDNYQVGFTQTPDSNSDLPDKETYSYVDDSLPDDNEPGKMNDNLRKKPNYYYELQNLKKIFLQHNIKKITFENNKLTIEYNGKLTWKKLVNNQEFQELEKYCKEHNESVIDSQKLGISSNNDTNSEPNKGNHKLVIGLAIGVGVTILVGIIIYFVRKRNKNNGKS